MRRLFTTLVTLALALGSTAMKAKTRRLTATLIALVLTMVIAFPAAALVWKTGYTYCNQNQTMKIRSYSTWDTQHIFPGGYNRWYYNGATWTVRTSWDNRSGNGGLWGVNTNGSLNDPGTYAFCVVTGGS